MLTTDDQQNEGCRTEPIKKRKKDASIEKQSQLLARMNF
jgi:hypothetical protein